MAINKQAELDKLRERTELPLSDIKFIENDTKVELYVKGKSIGWLAVQYTIVGTVRMLIYHTDKATLDQLFWDVAFKECQAELTDAVRKSVKENSVTLQPAKMKRVWVVVDPDDNSVPKLYLGVRYDKGEWVVFEAFD